MSVAQARSAELFAGAEAAEGMDAFLHKRAPSWERAGAVSVRPGPPSRARAARSSRPTPRAMAALVGELEALHEQVLAGGGPQYVERHRSRDKMMVRERAGGAGRSRYARCSSSARWPASRRATRSAAAWWWPWPRSPTPSAWSSPTTRRSGAGRPARPPSRSCCGPWTWPRCNRLPVVLLVESGGADLPRQADVFVPGGEQFRRLTQLSAQGIPTICVVFGSSTAGGAYLPGMSDYTIMVRAGPGCSSAGRRWSRWPSARRPTRRSWAGR